MTGIENCAGHHRRIAEGAATNSHRDEQRAGEKPGRSSQPLPAEGRLLGVDYGRRRIGVAISDVEQRLASPMVNHTRSGSDADARFFRRLIAENHVVGIVVGLPLHMGSGEESPMSQEARDFGAWLAQVTGLPVAYHDERLSTATAEVHLRAAELSPRQRRQRRDKVAAQVMLQSFLDRRHDD